MFEELVQRVEEMPADLEALATRCRANFAVFTGDGERGIQLYEESLDQYRRLGDEHGQAVVELRLAGNLVRYGQPERARAIAASALVRSRESGFRINEAMIRGWQGERELETGNTRRGLEMMQEALELAHEAGFRWMEANLLNALAGRLLELGGLDDAERHACSALAVARDMGDRRHGVQALAILAAVAAGRGDSSRAGRLWGAVEAEELRGPLGSRPRMAAWDEERAKFHALAHAALDAAFERALTEGRRLSLDDAVAYALARRYLRRSPGLKSGGIRPRFLSTSSHGVARDTRRRVPNVARLIFAMTFESIGAYFARILPLIGSFLS